MDDKPKLKIVFKMIFAPGPLTLTEIAKLCNIPRQLVNYHLPSLIDEGVVIEVTLNKFKLQNHFYNMEENVELLVPLIEKIADSIEGDYQDMSKVVQSNLFYFLTNCSIEFED
jgi:DNA-binding IclR family transcriptional regulator